jgi:hypothetical protein
MSYTYPICYINIFSFNILWRDPLGSHHVGNEIKLFNFIDQ